MTFRNLAKGSFCVALTVLACLLALTVVVWSLYFVVRLATTSYSIDWVDLDSMSNVNSWWPRGWEDCRRFVQLKDGRRLAVAFERWGCHKPSSNRYMLEIWGGAGIALHDGSVQVSIPGRENDVRIEAYRNSDMSLANGRILFILPIELSPQKEGEVLEIRFQVRCVGSSAEMDEVRLEFRACSVCHYLNIFTDIT